MTQETLPLSESQAQHNEFADQEATFHKASCRRNVMLQTSEPDPSANPWPKPELLREERTTSCRFFAPPTPCAARFLVYAAPHADSPARTVRWRSATGPILRRTGTKPPSTALFRSSPPIAAAW